MTHQFYGQIHTPCSSCYIAAIMNTNTQRLVARSLVRNNVGEFDNPIEAKTWLEKQLVNLDEEDSHIINQAQDNIARAFELVEIYNDQ